MKSIETKPHLVNLVAIMKSPQTLCERPVIRVKKILWLNQIVVDMETLNMGSLL